MTDLVEKVARITSDCRAYEELTGQLWEAHYVTARAAIAAVLDDLENTHRASLSLSGPAQHDVVSLLAAKRKELGL